MNTQQNDKVKMKCPICSHYIFGTYRNGGIASSCGICKSVVFSKEKNNGKEKLIKVTYLDAV